MTRDYNNPQIVRLSPGNWVAVVGLTFTVLTTFVIGTLSIERRLTEVVIRQEQLETRITRLETQIDETRSIP